MAINFVTATINMIIKSWIFETFRFFFEDLLLDSIKKNCNIFLLSPSNCNIIQQPSWRTMESLVEQRFTMAEKRKEKERTKKKSLWPLPNITTNKLLFVLSECDYIRKMLDKTHMDAFFNCCRNGGVFYFDIT